MIHDFAVRADDLEHNVSGPPCLERLKDGLLQRRARQHSADAGHPRILCLEHPIRHLGLPFFVFRFLRHAAVHIQGIVRIRARARRSRLRPPRNRERVDFDRARITARTTAEKISRPLIIPERKCFAGVDQGWMASVKLNHPASGPRANPPHGESYIGPILSHRARICASTQPPDERACARYAANRWGWEAGSVSQGQATALTVWRHRANMNRRSSLKFLFDQRARASAFHSIRQHPQHAAEHLATF